jgi:hypothetical protein
MVGAPIVSRMRSARAVLVSYRTYPVGGSTDRPKRLGSTYGRHLRRLVAGLSISVPAKGLDGALSFRLEMLADLSS